MIDPGRGCEPGTQAALWQIRMFKIVEEHGDLFPAFVASLPMNNVEAALAEMDRAIGELGARGVQIFTNVNGRPLDEPEFFPIFERMAGRKPGSEPEFRRNRASAAD
jgi:predicted TIM-barrel fold metal-dependent hydrolase